MDYSKYCLSQEEKNYLTALLGNFTLPEHIAKFCQKLKDRIGVLRIRNSLDRIERGELMDARAELIRLHREWMKEMSLVS